MSTRVIHVGINHYPPLRSIERISALILHFTDETYGKHRAYFRLWTYDGTEFVVRTPKDKDTSIIGLDRCLHKALVARTSLIVARRKIDNTWKNSER